MHLFQFIYLQNSIRELIYLFNHLFRALTQNRLFISRKLHMNLFASFLCFYLLHWCRATNPYFDYIGTYCCMYENTVMPIAWMGG